MYGKGHGVLEDNIHTQMWFNLAAVGGDKDAIKGRNIMASKMTQQQIGEAQKLARECQAQRLKGCD